jgi:hypothetical protein
MEAIVIIGAGPAGRAAAEAAPSARVVARPDATAWHMEPGRLWIEAASGVEAVPFTRLVLCADEPLLLMALGCAFAGLRPVVDRRGETSKPGVFAAGRILGASTAEEAARQGRIAAAAAWGEPVEGAIEASRAGDPVMPERLDPLSLAELLEQAPGPERNRAALAQALARGPLLSATVAPARPVGFAALVALAPASMPDRDLQQDSGRLA